MIGGVECSLLRQPPVHQYVTWCIYICGNVTEVISIHTLPIESHTVGEWSVLVVNDMYIVRVSIHTFPIESHIVSELSVLDVNDMYSVCVCVYTYISNRVPRC